ncbi:hypothetical protein Tco_1167076 [Tanacetum coccineum]
MVPNYKTILWIYNGARRDIHQVSRQLDLLPWQAMQTLWQDILQMFDKSTVSLDGDQPPLKIMQNDAIGFDQQTFMCDIGLLCEGLYYDAFIIQLFHFHIQDLAKLIVSSLHDYLSLKSSRHVKLETNLRKTKNVIDEISIPRNDESNSSTRIEPMSNKESPEVDITKDKEYDPHDDAHPEGENMAKL